MHESHAQRRTHLRYATLAVGGLATLALSLGTSPGFGVGQSAGSPTQARVVMCHGHVATIVGNAGSNEIEGTPGRDVIAGRGGNDDVEARAGNDLVCGGRGADDLEGERGADALYGNRGNDELEGDRGNDRLVGGRGFDRAEGGAGSDVCFAEAEQGC
jgi:Ca2+-binding RTX toxin-like protein